MAVELMRWPWSGPVPVSAAGKAFRAAATLALASAVWAGPREPAPPQLVPQVTNLSRTPIFPAGTRPIFIGKAPESGRLTVAVAARGYGPQGRRWAVYTRELEPEAGGLRPTNSRTFPEVAGDPREGLVLGPGGSLLVGGVQYSPAGARQFCELEGTCRVVRDPLDRGFLVLGPTRVKRVTLPIAILNRPVSFIGSREYGVWLEPDDRHPSHRQSKGHSSFRVADVAADALLASVEGVPRAFIVQAGYVLPLSLSPMLEGVPIRGPVERPVVARLSAGGDVLAVGLESGEVAIWNAQGDAFTKRFVPGGKRRRIRDLCFVGESSSRLAVVADKQLLIVDHAFGRVLASYVSRGKLLSVATDGDARYVAAVEHPDKILVFFGADNPVLGDVFGRQQ